jgi:hypothetical protein
MLFTILVLNKGVRMTVAAMLMREIETLPEEAAVEALDFVLFLRAKVKSNDDDGLKIWEGLTPSMKNPSHVDNFRKISREELYDRF